jgi:4-amino-4-deoxychorismate lyase
MKNDFFFETIKISNNKIHNIKYHNDRFNKTRLDIFNIQTKINLQDYIKIPQTKNIIKCRILYKENIHSITYTKYIQKKISSFLIVENNDIQYHYKSNHRQNINNLTQSNNLDEILIIKNNLLTDTSISNIAIFLNNKWITPKQPLLKGTMRNKLLYDRLLEIADINKTMLLNATKIALMNAMVGFYIIDSFKIKDFNNVQ